MKRVKALSLCLGLLIGISSILLPHGGRTDSNGGHYNRKTGEYHYHGAPKKSSTSSSKPRSSSYSSTTNPSTSQPTSYTENHWQTAFNNKVTKGKLEVTVTGGTVDIVTDTHAIEVDKVSKYQEGIAQVLKYASATEKRAGLALYIDGESNGYELFRAAQEICFKRDIDIWLINNHVSINDLVNLRGTSSTSAASAGASKASSTVYWINTGTNVRHNRSCRWFNNTSKGILTTNKTGKACGICGG